MARYGKISPIKKDYEGAFPTLETSLRNNGMNLFPGVRRRFTPRRKADGSYITGLTPEIQKELEEKLSLDLGPRSKFWNIGIKAEPGEPRVEPYALEDKDNMFNLDDPLQALNYYWLRSHPMIARSLEAYEAGEYDAETVFFVNDDEYENEKRYQKAMELNQAIIKFTAFSIEKRKKVVRLLGEPVGDDAKETVVYNIGNDFLRNATVKSGPYKNMAPIVVFNKIAEFTDDKIDVAHLVSQVLNNNIYREDKGGRIYEGDIKVAVDKEALIEHLLSDEGQEDRLDLEKRLKVKLIQQA